MPIQFEGSLGIKRQVAITKGLAYARELAKTAKDQEILDALAELPDEIELQYSIERPDYGWGGRGEYPASQRDEIILNYEKPQADNPDQIIIARHVKKEDANTLAVVDPLKKAGFKLTRDPGKPERYEEEGKLWIRKVKKEAIPQETMKDFILRAVSVAKRQLAIEKELTEISQLITPSKAEKAEPAVQAEVQAVEPAAEAPVEAADVTAEPADVTAAAPADVTAEPAVETEDAKAGSEAARADEEVTQAEAAETEPAAQAVEAASTSTEDAAAGAVEGKDPAGSKTDEAETAPGQVDAPKFWQLLKKRKLKQQAAEKTSVEQPVAEKKD